MTETVLNKIEIKRGYYYYKLRVIKSNTDRKIVTSIPKHSLQSNLIERMVKTKMVINLVLCIKPLLREKNDWKGKAVSGLIPFIENANGGT